MSASLLFTVANLRFNSVVNTKLPVILSHRRSNTVSLETYPLYSFAYNQVLNKVVHLHQYHQCYEDLSQIIIILAVITITNNSIIISNNKNNALIRRKFNVSSHMPLTVPYKYLKIKKK